MTNLNTITKNVNDETKTFTAESESHYYDNQLHTVSIKSIYDRILVAALSQIKSNFDGLDDTLYSDCGRFEFKSGIAIYRDNKNQRGDRTMRSAAIKYRTCTTDTTKDSDREPKWRDGGMGCNISVEVAKRTVGEGERTVYVLPKSNTWLSTGWDNDADTDDVDCTVQYGVATDVTRNYADEGETVTIDGITYYENVHVNTYTRKARINYNGRPYVFTTPEELDAAIDTIIGLITSEQSIDGIGKVLDGEQERLNKHATDVVKAEANANETEYKTRTIMGKAISMLDAAGFDKCKDWHREPAEDAIGGYFEIRMTKATDMGMCIVSVERFRRESRYCTESREYIHRQHEVDFGLAFGRGSNGTEAINADDLLCKIEKAIAMAELAG